ncbi:S8 family serine peptidase [Actinacidiphila sp. bgisy167]|uniref:S8 family serine peptidase n=1 Tax=Actinacidiphila sp. bgisy167 TaxID=3413797 RepID=UPI003D71B3FB
MTALAALLSTIAVPAVAAHAADPEAQASRSAARTAADAAAAHSLTLSDGSVLRWSDDGSGVLTRKDGTTRAFPVATTKGRSAFGDPLTPSAEILQRRAEAAALTPYSVGASAGARSAVRPQTMNSGAVPLPKGVLAALESIGGKSAAAPSAAAAKDLPTNEGLTTSFQSYLNAGGVNAVGAFQDTAAYLGALPGEGQIITNVSLGDLTDQSMADAGDDYVRLNGPTTVLRAGQRYLDFPSLPLIPTYTSDNKGRLDPTGSIEGQDPNLAEVLLDFSMMAPLPHDRQRPEATGSGATDLLGIAPGAKYRLVVPEEPSAPGIAAALRAAAAQKPRPNVITASLGFGTDGTIGFPSRWLEDDPEIRDTLRSIVDSGIVVVVSSNDGTRLGLPVSVGPDGGSTPTDVTTDSRAQTSYEDVAPTTTPTVVRDTGVIAAGGTTVDDTLSSDDVRTAVYPTTRYNGSAGYSSGFGSRIDLAAPGDNLPSLLHTPEGPDVVLNGGTSASAPMIAAAAANVLAAAEATGQEFSPREVRKLLVDTGRPIAQPPQADRELHMGTQLDVTAAVEKVLAKRHHLTPAAVRMSVAERQLMSVSPTTSFVEATDPAAIDLAGPADGAGNPSGQNAISPITFGLDLTGGHGKLTYRLRVDDRGTIPSAGPSLRVLPRELLAAAGLPLVSDETRSVQVTFEALSKGKVVASAARRLTFTPTDGTYVQPQAPTTPGSAPLGKPVTVHYDLTGLRGATAPELVLSSVGHWTPFTTADKWRAHWRTRLTGTKGTVTIPASAFEAGGAGLYGVGITLYDGQLFGDFRALRIGPGADERPQAPLLGQGKSATAHSIELSRPSPKLTVSWDASTVRKADGAAIEFLTPAPTLYGALNTATNQNGSGRDDNGVDHASTLFRALPSVKGRTVLDLEALGLPTGLQYPVRILPTRAGKPIGQASPTSFVEYLDGETVSGTLENFEVSNGTALIATDDFAEDADGWAHLRGSTTATYSLSEGKLGSTVSHETGTSMMQMVLGADPGTGHTLVAHRPFEGAMLPEVDLRDTATGERVRLSALDPGTGSTAVYYLGGVVDPARHRAAVSTFDGATGIASLWMVDMATGRVSAPIPLNPDSPGRAFNSISFDASTGTFFAATSGTLGPCLSGRVPYWAVSVEPSTRTVSPLTTMPDCTAGLLPDGKGDRVYVAAGPITSTGDLPPSTWRSADQKSLSTAPATDLGTRGVMWPVLDTRHHVALVASLYEEATVGDNNALSEITVLDPDSGKVLARHPVANLVNSTMSVSNFDFTSRRGLHIDPATRTVFLVNPWASGLQRFTY